MARRETNSYEQERDRLVKCVEDAYDALRLIPGLDANGPALVWLADHLLAAHSREMQPA